MRSLNRTIFPLVLVLLFVTDSLPAQLLLRSRSDKIHAVGNVRRVMTAGSSYTGGPVCEYPINSGNDHMIPGQNRLLFSCRAPSNSDLQYLFADEFLSAGGRYTDSIFVVDNYRTADLPFWSGYEGVSEEDFVFLKEDTRTRSVGIVCDTAYYQISRTPMNIEVIEQSLAWREYPLSDILLYAYRLIPKKFDLRDLYLSLFFRGGVGRFKRAEPSYQLVENFNRANNDQTSYFKEEHLAVVTDGYPGYRGAIKSCIAYKLFPPLASTQDSLIWTFDDNLGVGRIYLPCEKSEQELTKRWSAFISSGVVSIDPGDHGVGFLSVGPLNVRLGDTLTFWSAEILGMGTDDVRQKSTLLDKVHRVGFRVPKSPPPPPLRAEAGDKCVTLRWNARLGDVDPEKFNDPNRPDRMGVPFEGYRLFKSSTGMTGPWTLVAENDIPNNGFAHDLGIEREYTESRLLNGAEYFYSVTSFSKEDTVLGFPSLESSIAQSAVAVTPGTLPSLSSEAASVVPNPYRSDLSYHDYSPAWEKPTGKWKLWFENDRRIQFINIPPKCEIKIYTLAGDLVESLHHNDQQRGYHDWNLTSSIGLAVSSGIYLFTVQDMSTGRVQVGKFVILR